MDTMPMTPAQRLHGVRAYGRAANAFDSVAWRSPGSARFESRPANDPAERASAAYVEPMNTDIPHWVIVIGGGVIAALTGALLGGMLAV